jgi:hypothetical protein
MSTTGKGKGKLTQSRVPRNSIIRWEAQPGAWIEVRTSAGGFHLEDSTGFYIACATVNEAMQKAFERRNALGGGGLPWENIEDWRRRATVVIGWLTSLAGVAGVEAPELKDYVIVKVAPASFEAVSKQLAATQYIREGLRVICVEK